MKLLKATIKNLADLKSICIEAYSRNFHNHWNEGGLEWYLNNEFSTKRLTLDLKDEYTAYYFIIFKNEIVGFVKTKKGSILNTSNEEGLEIVKIYILPEFKGNGIGKFALNEIIEKTKTQNINYVYLSVIDTNINAINFYKTIGFTFHSKTTLDIPYFKEELKGMHIMIKNL